MLVLPQPQLTANHSRRLQRPALLAAIPLLPAGFVYAL